MEITREPEPFIDQRRGNRKKRNQLERVASTHLEQTNDVAPREAIVMARRLDMMLL